MNHHAYRDELATLRAVLTARLAALIAAAGRVLVIVEGRDAAGKTGAIRRLVRGLDDRHVRVVRLGPPTAAERAGDYFARWRAHLPAAGELIVFDRSWYNRAALEPVMGYCTAAETEAFLAAVPGVERGLVADRVVVVKLLLEIGRAEQARRLAARRARRGLTAIDAAAAARWDDHGRALAAMLARTDAAAAPWQRIAADDKRAARLAVIRAVIAALPAGGG
ncbi:MAG: polyphosphate kinase 2 [Kofleriaceae bacterium]|nr:polyphosphate kinase 2 [Kofleriaceae bacterium]MCB9572668.1 polyphosphate kinase 2 [Kofleriaceae bacterium]